MRGRALVLVAAVLLGACTNNAGALPCLGDDTCPLGQQCNASGRCEPATGPDGGGQPVPVVPGAPTGLAAVAGPGSASLRWLPPSIVGGSPLTGYLVTPFLGTLAGAAIRVDDPTANSLLITDLSAGTWTFQVAARNTQGLGAASESSFPVTVFGLSSVALDAAQLALEVGTQHALVLSGTLSSGVVVPIASGVRFAVTAQMPTGDVLVSQTGVVSAVAAGTATVTAAYGAKSAAVAITVNPKAPTLASIAVAPSPLLLPAGTGSATLAITGTFSDATTSTLANSSATFAPGPGFPASVSTAGVVTAGATAGTGTLGITVGPAPTVTVPVSVYNPRSGQLFVDDFAPGVSFAPFSGSSNGTNCGSTAFPGPCRDTGTLFNGHASLKVTESAGAFAGGALLGPPLNLSGFNALTFWAKASSNATLDHTGFGDGEGGGGGSYVIEVHQTSLTTAFQQFFIPIPRPEALAAATRLFFFGDGLNPGISYWFNDLQYVSLSAAEYQTKFGAVSSASSAWTVAPLPVGQSVLLDSSTNTLTYTPTSTSALYRVGWNFFALASSNPAVATISPDGLLTAVSAGTSSVTASFAALPPISSSVTVVPPLAVPGSTDLAPVPSVSPSKVISLFSSAYPPYTTATPGRPWEAAINWNATYSKQFCELTDPYAIGSHSVLKVALHHFIGVDFYGVAGPTIDATAMSTLHIDVWSPNPPARLQVQLVQDVLGTTVIGQFDQRTLATGKWIALELPLASFSPSLAKRNLVGQLLVLALNADGTTSQATVYLDNIYLHN